MPANEPAGCTRRHDGVLEKQKPHFDLGQIKAVLAQQSKNCFTTSARMGYLAMKLSEQEAKAAILAMNGDQCFYKSMSSYHDENIWQDVYHVPTTMGLAYVKLQLYIPANGGEPKAVISFKAK